MRIHSLNASFRSFRIRSCLMGLLIAATSGGCAFNISKDLTLNTPVVLPAETGSATAPSRIHTLKVSAPAVGANVFVFEDLTAGRDLTFSTRGSDGSVMVSTFTIPAGLKRADFTYSLTNDSGPIFSTALQDLFKKDQGSSVDAQVAADFKYGLTERRENVNLGFGNTNTIGLQMVVRLILTSNGQVVFDKNYTAFESDSYSTSWVTFPSSDFLDKLFQKALIDVRSQIASDAEIAKHL